MVGDVHIRELAACDETFLREAIYHAIYVPEGAPMPRWDIVNDPAIACYVQGWGRPGDGGMIAELPDGRPVGACWLRLWFGAERGYGFVDEQTPELSLAVLPEFRGRGIGSRLLGETLERAGRVFPAASLSVTSSNPAMGLYERFGFRETSQENGTSLMLRQREAL